MDNQTNSVVRCLTILVLLSGNAWLADAARAEMPADLSVIARGEIASAGAPQGTFDYHSGMTGIFYTAPEQPVIRMRYKIWTLVGEPVVVFTGKAAPLWRIALQDEDGVPLLEIAASGGLAPGTVRWNGDGLVEVSEDLMNLARIYDFSFLAEIRRDAVNRLPASLREGNAEEDTRFNAVSIYRSYRGILGKPGEWGWDVPGSPDWGATFSHRGALPQSFTRESFQERLIRREQAKEVMRRLLYAYEIDGIEPIVRLNVGDFSLNIHNLIFAIRQAEPEALKPLMGISKDYEEELADIVHGFAANVRRRGLTNDLERQARQIDSLVDRHRQRFSDRLVESWKHVRDAAASAAADQRAAALIQEIGPRVMQSLERGTTDYTLNLAGDIDDARDHFDSDLPISDAMAETWHMLEAALDPGAGQDLIGGRIRDNGDGTFTDVISGLQWTRFLAGQEWRDGEAVGEPDLNSVRFENEDRGRPAYYLDFAGHTDWRAPNLEELSSLIFCPYADKTHVEVTTTGRYTTVKLNECRFFDDKTPFTFTNQLLTSTERYSISTYDWNKSTSRLKEDVSQYFDSMTYDGKHLYDSDDVKRYLKRPGCWRVDLSDIEMILDSKSPTCFGGDELIWVRDDD